MPESDPGPTASDHSGDEVWSYRGYRIRPGEFVTAMVHFYRGEIARSNTWRTRLDNTTNWSVITTAAVLTFAFGSVDHSHVVILLSMLLVFLFLIIESRRYRYYELWALRVRLMETDFFAAMLHHPFTPHREWSARLVDSLLTPEYPISRWEAMGRRLRRNYVWIFLILGIAWTLKLLLYPSLTNSFESFLAHASIGSVPGKVVLVILACFYGMIFALSILTVGLRSSAGEVLSRHEVLGLSTEILQSMAKAASEFSFVTKHEQLAIIITEAPAEVGDQLLKILKRGVTSLQGMGMYSGNPRSVLFCAVAPSEIQRLKSVVYAVDESAFVVINPTEEVWGGGFRDLQPRWKRRKSKDSEEES